MDINTIVYDIVMKKMLKSLDYTDDGTVYDGEVEALFQTLSVVLKQPSTSKTDVGV